MRRPLYFVTLIVLLLGYAIMPGRASSHREAPLISNDPQADNTDVYAFVSPDAPDTVTMIASYIPFEDPAGGPNFYRFGDSVLYEIKIDNNGDGVEDITYQFRFTSQVHNPNTFLYDTGPITALDDPNRNMYQTYTVTRIESGRTVFTAGPMRTMYDNVGAASTPELRRQRQRHLRVPAGGRRRRPRLRRPDRRSVLPRPARVRPALRREPVGSRHRQPRRLQRAQHRDSGAEELAEGRQPDHRRLGDREPSRRRRRARPASETSTGNFVQVSRLGMPLVNEVVLPVGQKDKWNGSIPSDDGQFLSYVTDPEVPKLLQLVYGIPAPATPRNDLVQVFLTGVPGLNQPAGREGVGDASAQHRHPADGVARPPRRAGGRHPGLPERPPSDRRRDRHHAAGGGRRRSAVSRRRSATASIATTWRSARRSRTSRSRTRAATRGS